VEDLCDALHRAVTAEGIRGEVFQVATGVETSIRELAETCRDVVGGPEEITFGEAKPGEVYNSSVDISKIRRVLGFEPQVDLRDGLARTAAWYREHWSPDQG
jgi:UDP-glucose 4-epimerase